MSYKRLIPCVLVAVSLTSIAEQKDIILHGRQIAQPNSGVMNTLEMAERDAIANSYPWLDIVRTIKIALNDHVSDGDIGNLKRYVYKPPENTPMLIRTLASLALFNQTGNLDDVLLRLRSGDKELVETALGTASIIPHTVIFRDELFNLIAQNATNSSATGLELYIYFALRHYNKPEDIEVLQLMLNNVRLSHVMRQSIFRSLIYDDPNYSHQLSWSWIHQLFKDENDLATLKIMLEEFIESEHHTITISLIDAKRNQLTMLLQAINDVAPLDNL